MLPGRTRASPNWRGGQIKLILTVECLAVWPDGREVLMTHRIWTAKEVSVNKSRPTEGKARHAINAGSEDLEAMQRNIRAAHLETMQARQTAEMLGWDELAETLTAALLKLEEAMQVTGDEDSKDAMQESRGFENGGKR